MRALTTTSKCGREIVDEGELADLCIANSGDIERSAVVLTLHSKDLSVTWRMKSDTQGSDHFPVHISACDDNQTNSRAFSIVCWASFREAILLETGSLIDSITQSLLQATRIFMCFVVFPSQTGSWTTPLLAGKWPNAGIGVGDTMPTS